MRGKITRKAHLVDENMMAREREMRENGAVALKVYDRERERNETSCNTNSLEFSFPLSLFSSLSLFL